MFKKSLIIILFFFLVLSIKSGYLLCLYLPILIFYLFKDAKTMYYIYPSSLISLIIFDPKHLILYMIMVLLTTALFHFYKLGVKKDFILVLKPSILVCSYLTLFNALSIILYPTYDLLLIEKIIYPIISVLIYLFLNSYLSHILNDKTNIQNHFLYLEEANVNYIYLEVLLAILTVVSCFSVNLFGVNLAIIIGSFFAMYLSRKYKNILSLVYSIIIIILGYVLFKIDATLIIILISGIYLLKSIYTIGILNLFLALILIVNKTPYQLLYILIMITSILFEIFAYTQNISSFKKEVAYKEIHSFVQKSINEEILKFATVLDRFCIGFQNTKDYNEQISFGIKTIIDKHCKSCPNQFECFDKNKKSLYPTFKDILVLNQDAIYNSKSIENCFKFQSILTTSKILNQQYDFKNRNKTQSDANNYILLSQINGVSNALKNYVVDTISKTELNYQALYDAKQYLEQLEYYVTYYEIIRSYKDDFLIKIGIKNTNQEEIIPIIETLFTTITNEGVSVIITNKENNNLYFNVIPKINIDIIYAYGNLSAPNEIISGDNHLIKELDNGHILFAISDGMGKGYSAYYESNMTLSLVEDIVNLNIESSTALEILNTFYIVQDYLERYATLDFLDINRHKETANFYKMGANTTYIINKNRTIEKIINKNLPFGIEEVIDQNTYNLNDGDTIIMSSDGIIENFIDNESLDNFIKESIDLNPQQLVYEILNFSQNNEQKVKDDMTVIVLKIKKR